MSEGKRPGGLTALAVLNFVFGGIFAIFLLILLAALGAADTMTEGQASAQITENAPLLWISLLLGIVTVGLMITAGVGYLGQKRFLGRTLGNAYAICSLAGTAIGLSVQPFNIGTLIGLIYPILTLALINGTFKDDLVN